MANKPANQTDKVREDRIELPGRKAGRVRDIRGPGRTKDSPGGRGHRTTGLAKLPQAVVKITGYSKQNYQHVKEHVNYISRNGELPLEREDGTVKMGRGVAGDLVHDWGKKHLGPTEEKPFKDGQLPRKAAHLMLSSPEGTGPEKLREIARDFLHREFGEKTRYAFAIHEDTKNAHAHVVLAMRGYDGKKLRFGKPEIQAMREHFAEVSTEHGVALSASRRVDRGLNEATASARNNAEYRREQKGEVSSGFRGAVVLAYQELIGKRLAATAGEKRHGEEVKDAREKAAADARHYSDQARESPDKAAALERVAAMHTTAGARAAGAKSEREQFRELVATLAEGEKPHPLDRGKKGEPTAGMRVLVETVAKEKSIEVPKNYATDFQAARAFLNEHAKREIATGKERVSEQRGQNQSVELD